MRAAVLVMLGAVVSAAAAPPDVRLAVRVEGLRSDAGRVWVALFDSGDGFPGDADAAVRRTAVPITDGVATAVFETVPAGTYAIAVLHDEDDDGRLDTGWLGIPTEGIGASNDAQGRFGPARFARAKMLLEGDATVTIAVVYPYPF